MTMKYPDCNRQKKDSQGCTDWGKESRVVLEGKQSQEQDLCQFILRTCSGASLEERRNILNQHGQS